MYKITFSSYRCIHLCGVLVSVFFLFFVVTLIPGGLLPTFPIISIPAHCPSPFTSLPLPLLFLEEEEGGRGEEGGHPLIPHHPMKQDNEE